jgi:GWxTD domain-containing protein
VLVLGLSAALAGGCVDTSRPNAEAAGRTPRYAQGLPAFDVEAVAAILPQARGIEAYALLRAGTVMYTRVSGGFGARYDITFLLRDQETEEVVAEQVLAETLVVSQYTETQTTKGVRHQAFLAAKPGAYTCEVTIEDRNTGRSSFRQQTVIVPELREGQPMLGRVVMMGRDENGMLGPVVAFHLPLRRDSLSAQATLFNFPAGSAWLQEIILVRFVVDTAEAVAPWYFSTGPGNLDMRRYYPERTDTVFLEHRRFFVTEPGYSVTVPLPWLPEGMYQLTMRVHGSPEPSSDLESALTSRRYFSIMGPGFPRPVTLSEMAAAAVYLMNGPERQALDSARSVDERRRLFDGFWLSLVSDRQIAADLIRKYYTRVEEANRLFSSFKEGWKTDRGMVYIVLGPPERIERSYDRENWYYNHPGSARENLWQFRRVQFAPEQFTIEDYVLLRGVQYEMYWQRVLSKWREGVVF